MKHQVNSDSRVFDQYSRGSVPAVGLGTWRWLEAAPPPGGTTSSSALRIARETGALL